MQGGRASCVLLPETYSPSDPRLTGFSHCAPFRVELAEVFPGTIHQFQKNLVGPTAIQQLQRPDQVLGNVEPSFLACLPDRSDKHLFESSACDD